MPTNKPHVHSVTNNYRLAAKTARFLLSAKTARFLDAAACWPVQQTPAQEPEPCSECGGAGYVVLFTSRAPCTKCGA